jgi:hypothetical protein
MEVIMSGLNRQGPNEEGPMTGRRMGECNPDDKGKMNDEIFDICVGLAIMLIIGVTKIAGIWMKEKRLKSGKQ